MTVTGDPNATHFATIDSTNTEAKRRWAASDTTLPHWFLADQQTAGTGRRGRAWSSPTGNFSGSLLVVPDLPPADWHKFTYVISLALYDALSHLPGAGSVLSLKWPNDVLVRGQKVAGILLETVGQPVPEALIIGVGVNLAHAPETAILDERALPATSIAQALGRDIALAEFFPHLRDGFLTRWEQMRTVGWVSIRNDWQARCTAIGKEATVTKGDGPGFAATIAGLDDDGALLVRTSNGIERVLAGDVKVREV